jgi:hypothetical protein
MGYVKIPELPQAKPVRHSCQLPLNSLQNAIWQCDECGNKYIYRPTTFWGLMGLCLFILLPLGFFYYLYSLAMKGWIGLGIFFFYRTFAYVFFAGVLVLIIWAFTR